VNFGEASSSAIAAFEVPGSTEATVEGSTGTALASGTMSEKVSITTKSFSEF
jgi:hypothetical protein